MLLELVECAPVSNFCSSNTQKRRVELSSLTPSRGMFSSSHGARPGTPGPEKIKILYRFVAQY